MTDDRTGGPAFPRPASRGNNYATGEEDVVVDPQRGMSMRDYFAAAALQGILAGSEPLKPAYAAQCAFEVADAMIARRRGGT